MFDLECKSIVLKEPTVVKDVKHVLNQDDASETDWAWSYWNQNKKVGRAVNERSKKVLTIFNTYTGMY
jgi:hypothetical protein